jgi:predicted nucleic acid-binding protein
VSLFYLDASAWVKRYVQEPGSAWVHGLFDRQERIASSTLGYLEVTAALSRRLSQADFARVEPRLETDWQNMARLPITGEMMDRAVDLARQYKLRGADAVHLATALDLQKTLAAINESVVLVASDEELLKGAQASGLRLENPMTALP